ncbi:hypothetical protein MJO28_005269 [Puccinia striiformis f. sp. tritici]|uniref:Uncharacterized protein n=1 Tax=Puccinia striiformis f. sp. tritici TaxID=168172 RepID=A0ACC0EK73_9BASI|nr:hypothetical protein MJO28_005269 [Puccinia striiformis f. sp. tritici]
MGYFRAQLKLAQPSMSPNLTCYHIAIRLTDSSLDDDLGQIEYIFSDKMGTLTQKVMEFQRISIYGISYGEGVTEAMVGAAKQRQANSSTIEDPVTPSLIPKILIKDLTNPHPYNFEHRKTMLDFWKTLAICHDVILSRNDLAPN